MTESTMVTMELNSITDITSDKMLATVLNEKELETARNSEEIENVKADNGTTVVLNPILRDFYVDAYKKLETVTDNVILAKRKMIVAVMNSDDYKRTFVNDKDFAESINETKTFISKAKSSIATLKWLVDNGYGESWTASQLDEITPTLNTELKKDKAESFKTMLSKLFETGQFNNAMSSRKIREVLGDIVNLYNEICNPEQGEQENSEQGEQENSEQGEQENSEQGEQENSEQGEQENSEQGEQGEQETEKLKEVVFKELEITVTLENGLKCSLTGKSNKKSSDKVYKQISAMIQSNDIIKAELMKMLASIIR